MNHITFSTLRVFRAAVTVTALGVLTAVGAPTQAALVTNLSAFPVSDHFVDFNQFTGAFSFTNGPVEVGNATSSVTLTSTNAYAVLGSANFGLGTNGAWNSDKTGFVGLDGQNGDITFTFNDGPVSSVGAFINYSPQSRIGEGGIITALSSTGEVLETYDLRTLAPILTADSSINDGAFRGIVRANADIAAFRISNAYIVADDMRFSRSNVSAAAPEPGSFALAAFGCVPLGVLALRRRRRMA